MIFLGYALNGEEPDTAVSRIRDLFVERTPDSLTDAAEDFRGIRCTCEVLRQGVGFGDVQTSHSRNGEELDEVPQYPRRPIDVVRYMREHHGYAMGSVNTDIELESAEGRVRGRPQFDKRRRAVVFDRKHQCLQSFAVNDPFDILLKTPRHFSSPFEERLCGLRKDRAGPYETRSGPAVHNLFRRFPMQIANNRKQNPR